MSYKQFFRILLLLVFIAAVGFAVGNAWDLNSLMRAMFSDKPRFPARTTHSTSTEDSRGRAQELKPDINVPPPPEDTATTQTTDKQKFENLISGLEHIASLSSGQSELDSIPTQAIRPVDSYHKIRWAPPPPGFLTADTFNYLIYREKDPVTANIKTVLDTIHGNLMLDLTPFTILVKPNKILVMLFNSKASYHDFTHLPSWSGASSDLQSDTMYVIEGSSFYALSVHELTHLYFDGYFLPTISPLWLSEGMAVYMQIYASKQKPAWIDNSLRRILAGEIIPFDEMTAAEDLNSYDTSRAELWYTQAYSVVNYLLNSRTRDEFYKFCNELKNKIPLHQALYHAYGMPFNKVSVLQNVWLHDLHKTYQEGRILTPQQLRSAASNQLPPADGLTPAIASSPALVQNQLPSSAAAPQKKEMQKTKINKLQMVPVNSYQGGF